MTRAPDIVQTLGVVDATFSVEGKLELPPTPWDAAALAELAGNRHLVMVSNEAVSGHDIATGDVLWEFPLPEQHGPNAHVIQARSRP